MIISPKRLCDLDVLEAVECVIEQAYERYNRYTERHRFHGRLLPSCLVGMCDAVVKGETEWVTTRMKGFGLGKWCFLQHEWTELDEIATARKQVVGQSACMRALGAYSKASNHSLQTGAGTLVAPTSKARLLWLHG